MMSGGDSYPRVSVVCSPETDYVNALTDAGLVAPYEVIARQWQQQEDPLQQNQYLAKLVHGLIRDGAYFYDADIVATDTATRQLSVFEGFFERMELYNADRLLIIGEGAE